VGEREFAAVLLNVLHSFNEDGETRAVEISGLGKIDNQHLRFVFDHGAQRFGDLRRNVEIDFAFKLQYVCLYFLWHGSRNLCCLFHFTPASPVNHQPSVLIRRSTSEKSSIKTSG